MDEEQATIESQFVAYGKLFEGKTRTGETITLYNSDYWMRQANLLDDRKVTMTDTGILFNKFGKSEIVLEEWLVMLSELCALKQLDEERTKEILTNCGLPGESPVEVPQYQLAFRRCGADGLWVGRHLNITSPKGWTNYTPCFPAVVQNLFFKVYDKRGDAQAKFETAVITRYIEIVGYSISLITTVGSLYVYNVCSNLHNKRTWIHKNLFSAILLENIIRIMIYSDQLIVRDKRILEANHKRGIENMPYLCEAMYVSLEYATLVVYCWMLVEGIFLYATLTCNNPLSPIQFSLFCVLGWVLPSAVIFVWSIFTARHYATQQLNTCWYGYNYLPEYRILQWPILGIILINFILMVCIMQIVITKLQRTNDSELQKIKKSVRAALILLPLLGIGNIFNLIEYPLDGTTVGFAIWSYSTHFFRSFQGALISILYCYTNREVIRECQRFIARYRDRRSNRRSRRRTARDHRARSRSGDRHEHIGMTTMNTRGSDSHIVTIEPPPRARRRSRHQRATSLPVHMTLGMEPISPYLPPRVSYARPYVRPGLVTRDTYRARAQSCWM